MRKVWRTFDVDGNGTLEVDELRACLDALGAHVTAEDAQDMFNEADMDGSSGLDFREFIVALALGCVLHLAPSMEIYAGSGVRPAEPVSASSPGAEDTVTSNPLSSASAVSARPAPLSRAKSYVRSKQMEDVVASMQICLETFMLFDENGDGELEKGEVMRQLKEKSRNARRHSGVGFGAASFLSQERWEAMAWDRRGTITFREFCVSFYDWICPDGDTSGMEDDEDEDEDGGLPQTPISAALMPSPRKPGGLRRRSSDEGSLGDSDVEDVAVITTAGGSPVPPPMPPPGAPPA